MPSSSNRPVGATRRARGVVVVGGGIVGLATAYRLLEADPDRPVTVLEREPRVGTHQSSRNSGVLHAGLYYPPGSRKARWAVAGKQALEAFCEEHGVPVVRSGKVVVAVDPSELDGLRRLAERARTNGVEVTELDAAEVAEHEPHVAAIAGLWSPGTAVTDFGRVCEVLAAVVEARGGRVLTGVAMHHLDDRGEVVRIATSQDDLEADAVVVCAGAQADRIARASGADVPERIVPFRGSWLRLRPDRAHLVRSNIYPVPVGGGLPFLGVHLTRRVDGEVWIGPNAVLAGARDAARPWQLDRRDLAATLGFAGTWRLGRRHLDVAAGEVWRDAVLRATLREVQAYVPEIGIDDVRRGPFGVRSQLVSPDGALVDDFEVRGSGRIVHLLNAPSPAATASLSIGAALADEVAMRTG